MIGKESIDLGLKNIYQSWFRYRKGKTPSYDLDCFKYNLEVELHGLYHDLVNSTYGHGDYRKFNVTDNKKREISVHGTTEKIKDFRWDLLNSI